MATDVSQHTKQDTPSSVEKTDSPVRVACPSCGQVMHVVPVVPAAMRSEAGEVGNQAAERPFVITLGRMVYNLVRGRRAAPSDGTGVPRNGSGPLVDSRQRWATIGLITLILVVGAAFIWLGRPARDTSVQTAVPAPTVAGSGPGGVAEATRAALIETLSGYNRAETEAAALLTIEPLLPFIDPTSPFAEARAGQLAQRRQQNAPHRTMLVRWAIGEIRVNGTTASVVTQETWSNQEVGVVAAEQATVRVSYVLRQDGPTGRWLIVESRQTLL